MGVSLLSDLDLRLFQAGTHQRLYERLGAHRTRDGNGTDGVWFAVWAPHAESVSVVGDFNGWGSHEHSLRPRESSGVWERFVPGLEPGALYKYRVREPGGAVHDRADPYGVCQEVPPRTASIVWDLDYRWGDGEWMASRRERQALSSPMSIYELHVGSWKRVPEEDERPLSYRELAPQLAEYVSSLGFTHVQLMPVMEHPFVGSWGYQITGYFAATSRYGTPQDLMFLIDHLHQHGIGVILDWVPGHFPPDAHGLARFDGSPLYEHADPRSGSHPDGRSCTFDYGRREVRSFLLSSAMFWLDRFHADGLRVNGVASMLHSDASPHEGRENAEAIHFLRHLNEAVGRARPDVQMIAAESTSWPMVSRSTLSGGLGFGLKWDVGWLHDTLRYFERDPVHRRYHHCEVTFRSQYAFDENYVLPLSHDEVVHGKGSLLNRMPGDRWQKFANLRLLYGYMYSQPGKKLLFMGSELAQWREWSHDASLDWHLLDEATHAGVHRLVGDLNRRYRDEPSLHARDAAATGFAWVEGGDAEHSVLAFLRHGGPRDPAVLVVVNCTPVVRYDYAVGVPVRGVWDEILNTDAEVYGGTGVGNLGRVEARPEPCHEHPYHLSLTLPPLAVTWLRAPVGAQT